MKISYAAVLTVAALALQCAPSHAQGWRYYGNRSGESVGFADGLSQAPGGGLSQGPGGGLSVGPGGGLSQGMGGGLSVGPGGGLSVGMGGGLSQGPGGGLSQGPGGGLSVAMLGGLAVAPCGGLAVAPCGLPGPQRLNYLVFFDWDRFTLTRPARDLIAAAAKAIVEGRPARIEVNGHADLTGPAAYNQKLSQRRARVVADELIADGVPAREIQIRAFGDRAPLVPTGHGVREPQNRRVEIIVVPSREETAAE